MTAESVAGSGQLAITKRGSVGAGSAAWAAAYFSETKIKDLGLAPPGDHDVRTLDVAVGDASCVGGVEGVGNLNCEAQQ